MKKLSEWIPMGLVISFFTFAFSLSTFLCKAQITNLHSFTNNETPYGSLTLSQNVLYGMTFHGGVNSEGYVFSMNTNGSGFKDLWDFYDTGSNGNANGESPYGSVVYTHGKLYGMTYYGGAANWGVIFSIDSNGGGYKDLWDFDDTGSTGNANGANPYGSLIYSNGLLFGFTFEGGANNEGLVFSIDTNGRHYKDIYDFTSGTGGYPYYGALVLSQSGNVLYGVTYEEGLYDYGVVYSVDTDGSRFNDLLNFNGTTNGEAVYNSIILSGNKLFGMTYQGGATSFRDGTVYTIDTSGNNYKDLFNFDGTNGARPFGEVTILGSTLYGMTYDGGLNSAGNLFSIDSSGTGFADLYDFSSSSPNGSFPFGDLALSGDTLFGMTQDGGTAGYGNIFSYLDTNISTSANRLAVLSSQLSVYPNPSTGIFTFQSLVVSGQWSVEVYNMLGEEMYSSFNIQHPTFNIDLRSKSNGVYFYRVVAENGGVIGAGKLVVEK